MHAARGGGIEEVVHHAAHHLAREALGRILALGVGGGDAEYRRFDPLRRGLGRHDDIAFRGVISTLKIAAGEGDGSGGLHGVGRGEATRTRLGVGSDGKCLYGIFALHISRGMGVDGRSTHTGGKGAENGLKAAKILIGQMLARPGLVSCRQGILSAGIGGRAALPPASGPFGQRLGDLKPCADVGAALLKVAQQRAEGGIAQGVVLHQVCAPDAVGVEQSALAAGGLEERPAVGHRVGAHPLMGRHRGAHDAHHIGHTRGVGGGIGGVETAVGGLEERRTGAVGHCGPGD